MNPTQNKLIHALLAQTNLTKYKPDLVSSFSDGRTEHSAELDTHEAQALIAHLKSKVPVSRTQEQIRADKMRKSIISMAWEMNWVHPETHKCDIARINAWCIKYGYLKKPMNAYLYTELPALVTQFKNVYKSYLKTI